MDELGVVLEAQGKAQTRDPFATPGLIEDVRLPQVFQARRVGIRFAL